jgi:hypothetical protein
MEQIERSETSANINQTSGKHPKENTLNIEHGESLKSRMIYTKIICDHNHSLFRATPIYRHIT